MRGSQWLGDGRCQEFSDPTKEAIARAVKGEPKASTVTAKKDKVKHPLPP
jgi:5,6,7,8-tetrahydromethanopterin hydro-lyase